jgi:polar amino acid transport system permease protein
MTSSSMDFLSIAFLLLKGLFVSLELAVVVLLVGTIFGFAGGILVSASGRFVRLAIGALVVLVRGTPLLIQVFAVFYVLPLVGPALSPFTTAATALSLYAAVTITEIVRGSIASLPKGQVEGAYALGLSKVRAFQLIVLPQAMRTIIPSLVGQFVWLIKGTAIISLLGVPELMHSAKAIIERTLRGFEVMILVWVYYTAICLPLSIMGRRIEAILKSRGFSEGASAGSSDRAVKASALAAKNAGSLWTRA